MMIKAKKKKWTTLIALLIFMAMSAEMIAYIKIEKGVTPTLLETLIEITNETQFILFPLMFLFLLVTNAKVDCKKTPISQLKGTLLVSAQYMILFISANLFYCGLV
jgi:hypothetical protein